MVETLIPPFLEITKRPKSLENSPIKGINPFVVGLLKANYLEPDYKKPKGFENINVQTALLELLNEGKIELKILDKNGFRTSKSEDFDTPEHWGNFKNEVLSGKIKITSYQIISESIENAI